MDPASDTKRRHEMINLYTGDGDPRSPTPPPGLPTTGFVILGPSFEGNSAGIGCLYKLCHELRALGYSAFMAGGQRGAPHLDAPMIDLGEAVKLCGRGYVAVYPETGPGNLFGSPTVIRWVLNRPGLLAGDEVFADDEIVFCYSDVYRPYVRNRVAGKLYMPTINEDIFHADEWDISRRSLECFYVGKSTWKEGVVDRKKAFEITRHTPAKADLGKLFRASRVLYCFDNSTILVHEALLCGCPVVIIPDGTQTKQDYAGHELGTEGIAWGMEEFRGESVDVPAVQRNYEQAKSDFRRQLDHFVAVSGQKVIAPGADAGVRLLKIVEQSDAQTGQSVAAVAQPCRPVGVGRHFEKTFRRWWRRRPA